MAPFTAGILLGFLSGLFVAGIIAGVHDELQPRNRRQPRR